jgi:outer membrane lipoprotein SlyB
MNRTYLIVTAAAISLAGCASDNTRYGGTTPAPVGEASYPVQQTHRYGYVESIETVSGDRNEGLGVGAVGGAIAGGVLGNQVGHGTGRAAATVGGAVIGGVVGHQVEQRVRGKDGVTEYAYRVRMDDGSYQTFRRPAQDIRVGDRVRIEGGTIFPM